MKRILFYYDNYCGEDARGGTEVATYRVAHALRSHYGMGIYLAYLRRKTHDFTSFYDGEIRLKKSRKHFIEDLADFINRNQIDVIINEGRFFRQSKLRAAIKASGRDVKLLFTHHFAPGSERIKAGWKSAARLLRLDPLNPIYYLRLIFYPLFKLPRRLMLQQTYRKVHDMSDAVVLLSAGYISEYIKVAGNISETKFVAIPNIYQPEGEIQHMHKEKRVLILSRMDEIQKRVSQALKIWKKIEGNRAFDNWQLDIVGSGHELKPLKKLAKRLGLKRSVFHGWKNSEAFLKSSSILMMTSLYEGLPLSMIEAQSYGCVPIAFNSYASLTDVIEDNKTGVIVEEYGNIDDFATKLCELMRNEAKLTNLAAAATKCAATKFSPGRIATLWLNLIDSL